MPVIAIGVSHHQASTDDLARFTAAAEQVAAQLRGLPSVDGVLVLATCNRCELYVDTQRMHQTVRTARSLLVEAGADDLLGLLDVFIEAEAVAHLLRVACGLDSMVVGEVEIAGQVRKVLASANEHGSSPALHRLFQMALTTSKRVANHTVLSGLGRSIASVALDLAEQRYGRLNGATALLLGTGSYAGTVTADLTRRGAHVQVHSSSGRAQAFADRHPAVTPVTTKDLPRTIAKAAILVSCSGTGTRTLRAEDVTNARQGVFGVLPIVDLAVSRDLDPQLANSRGIDLIDLDVVGANSPPQQADELSRAHALVNQGVDDYLEGERSRAADPAVTAIRSHVDELISRELGHVKAHYSAETAEVVQRSLRRMANKLLHAPSQRAADFARNGELVAYVEALHTVFGIEVDQ
ncbi:MAG: glutamyl-tRNA reductase [Brooklawnia sp.]